MTERIYRVYDTVTRSHMGPLFLEKRDEAAVRTFTDVLKDKNTTIGQHPDDYELHCLGELDPNDGNITPAHLIIATGKQWTIQQEITTNG